MNKVPKFLLSLVSAIAFGCGDSNTHNHRLNSNEIADLGVDMNMKGMVVVITKDNVTLHVPETLLEEPGFNEMLTEIDTSVRPFQMFLGGGGSKFSDKIRAIHFHNMTDYNDDLRATYVGDGVILACYHKRTPHLFCLSEALGDLARDKLPGFSPAEYESAENVSRGSLVNLYVKFEDVPD